MLAARVDLLQESQACRCGVLPVRRVDEQLGEAEDCVEGRPQLVAHARQEHALVLVRLDQLRVGLLQPFQQPRPVEGRGDCGHELLHAADLVRAEAGRERSCENSQAAAVAQAADLQQEEGRLVPAQLDVVHALAQRNDLALDLRHLIFVETPRGQHASIRLERHGRRAAGQPHGPLESSGRERVPVLMEQKEVLHERAQTLLF